MMSNKEGYVKLLLFIVTKVTKKFLLNETKIINIFT